MQRESGFGAKPLNPSLAVDRPKATARADDFGARLETWIEANSNELQSNTDARLLSMPPGEVPERLRERWEFLLRQKEAKRTSAVGFEIRRSSRRRPRRAGRAETACMAASLPPYARVDVGMTNATIRVYGTLWWIAEDGRDDPSVAEIAEHALCDIRTAQLALAALQKSGHLSVTYRRVRRGMNSTSVYRLAFRRTSSPTPARQGESCAGVKNVFTPIERKDSVVTTSSAHEGCSWKRSAPARRAESDHKIASFEGSARKVRSIPGRGATQAQRRAGFGVKAGRLAVVSLEAQGVGAELAAHDCEAICAAVDRLRRQRFPGFSAGFWEKSVGRLGFRAYLAVIEVVELAAIKQIDDMTAYLGGILRKPSDEVRPDVTLARLQYSAEA